jgi:hypothetical protein
MNPKPSTINLQPPTINHQKKKKNLDHPAPHPTNIIKSKNGKVRFLSIQFNNGFGGWGSKHNGFGGGLPL